MTPPHAVDSEAKAKNKAKARKRRRIEKNTRDIALKKHRHRCEQQCKRQ